MLERPDAEGTATMIYEERTYTIVTGRAAEYIRNYETLGLPVQLEVLGRLIGFWQCDVGPLNTVVHIWAYDSLDDRARRRALLAQHPKWPAYLKANLDLIVKQENRVLMPVSFSPLQ